MKEVIVLAFGAGVIGRSKESQAIIADETASIRGIYSVGDTLILVLKEPVPVTPSHFRLYLGHRHSQENNQE